MRDRETLGIRDRDERKGGAETGEADTGRDK